MEHFDVVIIGSGTAGQSAAFDLVAEGYNVALIEHSNTPGGVCALRGCQAKKWFYEITEIVARSRHLHDKGITAPPAVDWQQIRQEKNAFTAAIPENTVANLRGNGIRYIEGQARFVNTTTLATADTTIEGKNIIVASGARPMDLPFDGNEHLISSDDFLELPQLPQRIAFVGGGFISFEFAHFAARLGSTPADIHILEVAPRPLGPFDGDMVEQLVKASENEGMKIHTDISITSVRHVGSHYVIELASGENVEVDLVVHGAGRVANLETLDLDAAGVEYGKGGITVNNAMQTTCPTIYAVGDCAQSLQLARVADMEAQIAAAAIVAAEEGEESLPMNYHAAPAVLFTYPQLAMVGKTEEALQQEGIKYWKSYDTQVSFPTYRRVGMKYAAYKILVDGNDHILGAHILSDSATGLINTFKQAMIDNVPIAKLRDDNIMAPYPSRESDIIYMLDPLLD